MKHAICTLLSLKHNPQVQTSESLVTRLGKVYFQVEASKAGKQVIFPTRYPDKQFCLSKTKLVSDKLHQSYAFHFPENMQSSASVKMNKTSSLTQRIHGV